MNLQVGLTLRWSLGGDGERHDLDPLVFELLHGVRQGGHLNYAARAAGVSYRHAWGLLRDWETRLGKPLLVARQGRGAHLTELGEILLELGHSTTAALAPALDGAAVEAGARLSEAADPRRHPVRIVSSHSTRMAALRDTLNARYRVSLDLLGSESALHRYRRGDADLAGFHLPQGELGRSVGAHLINLLDPARDLVWLLETRTLGLVSRPRRACRSLAALARGKLRFINRQAGSGTRLVFDGLLGNAGIAPGSITGYADEEYTHTAVAAMVASGNADAGFASAAAAAQMKLHFEPMVDERFYVVMSRDGDPALRRALGAFCAAQPIEGRETMKPDELQPTIAVLKRVHRAGFWKAVPAART
ncbi:MAG: substrate-binding domain-containing protein [Gammaproteobacteria bacterium]